jgi:hypothetical protein
MITFPYSTTSQEFRKKLPARFSTANPANLVITSASAQTVDIWRFTITPAEIGTVRIARLY